MCGIIACRTNGPALDYLLPALKRLEYRGYDSVGVAVRTEDGDIARLRTIGRIGALEQQVTRWTGPELDGLGIGHTRWATHGGVDETNAHPHLDCTGRIAVVHNGIITNADELGRELRATGHRFTSDVDSEVVPHLIEDCLATSGNLLTAVQQVVDRLSGSWALAVLEQGTGRLVAAANRSPLLVARARGCVFATSDAAAIADWVDEFRTLDDGDVVELGDVFTWNRRGARCSPPPLRRQSWARTDLSLGRHTDFMSKEITEQPRVAARLLTRIGGGVADGSLWSGLGLPDFDRLRVVACGTSMHAGQVIGNCARGAGAIPFTATVASETLREQSDPKTLTLAISQSGETADVLRALDLRSPGDGPLLALTNSTHSTLARRADAVLPCSAGPEIGVAATKTFVCQVISGVSLMLSSMVATERLAPEIATRLMHSLNGIPARLAAAVETAQQLIPPIVDELATATGFVFLGRGAGVPYAAEGALKLKELTYRWAEHHPAGELKHGPLAVIESGTPVVVVDHGDPRISANIAEVRARGGRIISIGIDGSTVPVLHPGPAPCGPLESVVPMQVLARELALALGRDVDKPRNLAKSVTVE
ncbi:glutamine--fructose-6-phosphate transaminase (isomerizing) [Prescottella defluvii]|uniref:glutamine--fructose-6-phosphate transaminase (isomerizing) n=1 Tax=Prescottella defluvii TaxID=1323361 RepID=UPI0004F3135C|nr:glutamine--fructose-6-phosphate transaminase (isomerizing) [Prescottella defluvii]